MRRLTRASSRKSYSLPAHCSRSSRHRRQSIGFDQFARRKDALLAALTEYQKDHGYLFSALMVTDVTRQCSMLLVAGSMRFLERIDYPKVEPGIFELREVVSRKKQLLPYLTHCLQRMPSAD
ncbi:MAG: hypothetical protein NT167_13255 [Verrucomicrobia bacterium]|nr:hypothetical protein [Verrucomicrobiota bacterium]